MQPGGGSRSLREHFSGSAPLWVGKLEPQLQGLTAGLGVSLRIHVFLPSCLHFHNYIVGVWGWGLSWDGSKPAPGPFPIYQSRALGTQVSLEVLEEVGRSHQSKPIPRSPAQASPTRCHQHRANTRKGSAYLWSSSSCFCRSPLHIHCPKLGTPLHTQTLSTSSSGCDTSLCRRDTSHISSQVSCGCFSVSLP